MKDWTKYNGSMGIAIGIIEVPICIKMMAVPSLLCFYIYNNIDTNLTIDLGLKQTQVYINYNATTLTY